GRPAPKAPTARPRRRVPRGARGAGAAWRVVRSPGGRWAGAGGGSAWRGQAGIRGSSAARGRTPGGLSGELGVSPHADRARAVAGPLHGQPEPEHPGDVRADVGRRSGARGGRGQSLAVADHREDRLRAAGGVVVDAHRRRERGGAAAQVVLGRRLAAGAGDGQRLLVADPVQGSLAGAVLLRGQDGGPGRQRAAGALVDPVLLLLLVLVLLLLLFGLLRGRGVGRGRIGRGGPAAEARLVPRRLGGLPAGLGL